MVTANEITSARKSGNIQKSYELSLQLLEEKTEFSIWETRAILWTVIAKLKTVKQESQEFYEYINLLKKIDKSQLTQENDTPLLNSITYWIDISNPYSIKSKQATEYSKNGNHKKAIAIFEQEILNKTDSPDEYHLSYAWSIYRYIKELSQQESCNTDLIRHYLLKYTKLKIEKPSKIHTCFLYVAYKINDKFDFSKFVNWWDLKNLQEEDFIIKKENIPVNENTEKKKNIESFAIRVIQTACKSVIDHKNKNLFPKFFPYLELAIKKSQDSTWLRYYKIDFLIGLNQIEEARTLLISFIKIKNTEFWVWSKLASLYLSENKTLAISCYCKSLLCVNEIEHTQNVKIDFAKLLVELKLFENAKIELDEVIHYKLQQNEKITQNIIKLIQSDWYNNTVPTIENNLAFYHQHKQQAEELVFHDFPWKRAVLGEFYIKKENNKKRYKLYIETDSLPLEETISASKVMQLKLNPFDPCNIKGEIVNNKFELYLIEKSFTHTKLDVLKKQVGIIDNINSEKNIIHILINQDDDCIIEKSKINFPVKIGMPVEISSCQSNKKKKVISIQKSKQIPTNLIKNFTGITKLSQNQLSAFVDDIFISSALVYEHRIIDNEEISGIAILNYNKKRNEWGWKAINIQR